MHTILPLINIHNTNCKLTERDSQIPSQGKADVANNLEQKLVHKCQEQNNWEQYINTNEAT